MCFSKLSCIIINTNLLDNIIIIHILANIRIILDSRTSSRLRVSPSPVTPTQPSRSCTKSFQCTCTCTCQHHCSHCHSVSSRTRRSLIFRPPENEIIVNKETSDDRLRQNQSTSNESHHQAKV